MLFTVSMVKYYEENINGFDVQSELLFILNNLMSLSSVLVQTGDEPVGPI